MTDADEEKAVLEDDYTAEIMKKLGYKDRATFKMFIVMSSRIITSFMDLLSIESPAQAVFVVLFEMLKHNIISKKKFLETMSFIKEQRDDILKENGVDINGMPANAVIVVKHEDAKKSKNNDDVMFL